MKRESITFNKNGKIITAQIFGYYGRALYTLRLGLSNNLIDDIVYTENVISYNGMSDSIIADKKNYN